MMILKGITLAGGILLVISLSSVGYITTTVIG